MAKAPKRAEEQPAGGEPAGQGGGSRKSHAQQVKPGRLPVSEFAFDRAGAASPFGDDINFPVDPERLTYRHLNDDEQPHVADTHVAG